MSEIQIDVLEEKNEIVVCHLYINGRCCQMIISGKDYQDLIRDGIFIRDGKTKDRAGILNTSKVFIEKEIKE